MSFRFSLSAILRLSFDMLSHGFDDLGMEQVLQRFLIRHPYRVLFHFLWHGDL